MEAFSADWLALREPADAGARATALEASLVATLARHGANDVTVVDLGAGAGSNARHLIPRLPGSQQWLLVDHDHELLTAAVERTHRWAGDRGFQVMEAVNRLTLHRGRDSIELRTSTRDLAALDEDLFEGHSPLLVTAAALLDLTSSSWIERLADRCRAARATALFALTYDGRIQCTPPDPFDAVVQELVNAHQQTDKGFGPAAGPTATSICVRVFEIAGFRVTRAPSDWHLGPDHATLQQQLVDGWATAALELVLDRADQVHAWRGRRAGYIAAGTSHIIVGHQDLLACPLS
jgi:SAM-dependent methyltransferase